MPNRTPVLVVDDATAVRKYLGDFGHADRGLVVMGTASDGRLALAALSSAQPGVVLQLVPDRAPPRPWPEPCSASTCHRRPCRRPQPLDQ
jgi:hypothetical protein